MRHSLSLVTLAGIVLWATPSCSEFPLAPPQSSGVSRSQQSTASYRITDLGNIGGSIAVAWRINKREQVAGWATTAAGRTHAILWTPKQRMIDLGTISGGTGSEAWGLNQQGTVVGEIDLPNGHVRAFLWTAGTGMRDLGTLGGEDALAQGVNDEGEVVGFSTLIGGGITHGFVWTERGGMKDAGTLNDANTRLRTITQSGSAGAGTGQGQAVLWHPSTGFVGLGFLPGGSFSYGARINEREQIAGFADTDISIHAFRWTHAAGMVDLSALNGVDGRSEALDISDSGLVVGASTTVADPQNLHAFIWNERAGMLQLPSFTNDVDDEAYGLNETRDIVGYADTPDGVRHAVLWTTRQ